MSRTIVSASVLLSLTLAACQQAEAPQTAEPAAMTPAAPVAAPEVTRSEGMLTSDGLGAVKIGMTSAEVAGIWGGEAAPAAEADNCTEFHPPRAPDGVNVMMQDGRLTRITLIRDSAVQAGRGVGLGDQAAEVKALYGDTLKAEPAKYAEPPAEDLFAWDKGGGGAAYVTDPTARGVRFEVDGEGRVTIIHAGDPSIQLVEGCH